MLACTFALRQQLLDDAHWQSTCKLQVVSAPQLSRKRQTAESPSTACFDRWAGPMTLDLMFCWSWSPQVTNVQAFWHTGPAKRCRRRGWAARWREAAPAGAVGCAQ